MYQLSADLSENLEKIAPIIGPNINPSENAIPTKAFKWNFEL